MSTTFKDEGLYYTDTPRGLVTASGTSYRTTEEQLWGWARPVLEEVPLEQLLRQADIWLRSPRAAALWMLLVLLFVAAPGWAAFGAGVLFLGWSLLCPAYASGPVANVFRWLENAFVQGLPYVGALSILAAQGRMVAVVVGLVGFVVLRLGLLDLLLARPVRRAQSALYPLPTPDQVLRALIVRTALQRRRSLPELDRMERALLNTYSSENEEK